MSHIMDTYQKIFQRIEEIQLRKTQAIGRMQSIVDTQKIDLPERIRNLKGQIEKADEYLLQIKAFRQLAEKHINSMNALTIEAPEGYRVNLNRLRSWAQMIDPESKNDPYAQRVFLVAKCDECFLNKKKRDFEEKIKQLTGEADTAAAKEKRELEAVIRQTEVEIKEFAESRLVRDFIDEVVHENSIRIFPKGKALFVDSKEMSDCFSPGAVGLPLDFDEKQNHYLKQSLGAFYDEKGRRVYLPIDKIDPNKEFLMTVSCVPARARVSEMDAGIRNFILNVIDQSPVGSRKVYILDAERGASALAGSARKLEDSFVLEQIARNNEQISNQIVEIAAEFSDIDEILESYDTVADYNEGNSADKWISRKLLVLVGWPYAFSDEDKKLVRKMLANYDRYGISLITVSLQMNSKDEKSVRDMGLSEYDLEEAIRITMTGQEKRLQVGSNDPIHFSWYPYRDDLADSYAESLKALTPETDKTGNEYTKLFDMVSMPSYVRDYKKISLPFGIDGRSHIHYASFENENFAAYLVGASRSGKSTLLHTLIAGLIRDYHPDNVELWLADFKQLEFEKYITYLPPHVKYVLLDESEELVFDLIDKLTERMMERQHLFARLGKERIDQIDPKVLNQPLPLIFIILDEFSIMSQVIAENENYRLRLQNLLAKGAALGIRFLFSSQTFTTGIRGLTPTARAQIQQRISMKASREEIGETLELSANLKTEQVRNWMDALPPHYALIKSRKGPDQPPEVDRVLVLYFEDYAPRNQMIEMLNRNMHPVDVYDPQDITSYVDKKPVLVDGKNYEQFSDDKLKTAIAEIKKQGDLAGDEIFVNLGTPRLMTSIRPIALSQESRENLLLIARSSEQACSASIVTSVLRSFLLQQKKCSVWAYGRNKLYQFCKKEAWGRSNFQMVTYVEDEDAICDAIYELKEKIRHRESSSELIILLGMERIYSDFEFGAEGSELRSEEKERRRVEELRKKGAFAESDVEKLKVQVSNEWFAKMEVLEQELSGKGLSETEIEEHIQQARTEFFEAAKEKYPILVGSGTKASEPAAETEEDAQVEEHQPGVYDARADFQFILRQGSRQGYHFMMVLNNVADLKSVGTKTDLYRHRLCFQVSRDDSFEIIGKRSAESLPEHICQYTDLVDGFSFRPYLHHGIGWEGWFVEEDGTLISPFVD